MNECVPKYFDLDIPKPTAATLAKLKKVAH